MIVVALCVAVSLAAPHGGYGGYGGYGGGYGGGIGNNYAGHGGYGGYGGYDGHGPHGGIGNFYGWMVKIAWSRTCGWDIWPNYKQDGAGKHNFVFNKWFQQTWMHCCTNYINGCRGLWVWWLLLFSNFSTPWSKDKMATILRTTYSNSFYSITNCSAFVQFYLNLFPLPNE